jgi:hypothetical protein
MNGYWLRTICMSVLTLGACTTGKFSDDFSSEIQRDCIETVGCNMTGQIETCIASVGESLDGAHTSQQQFFVDAAYRCQGSLKCDWVNCVQSTNASGFASSRLQQITYDCQQRAMCRLASGQTVSPDSVDQCVQMTGNQLNANPTDQANFDARFSRCSAQAGCSWGACQ